MAMWWRATYTIATYRPESASFSEPAWLPGNTLFVYYHNLYLIYCLFLRDFCTPHRTILRTCVAARQRLIYFFLSHVILDLLSVSP